MPWTRPCAAALAAIALAGCGGASSAGQTAKAFLSAVGNADSAQTCSLLSAAALRQLFAGASCKDALGQAFTQAGGVGLTVFGQVKGASVLGVTTHGNRASASVRFVGGHTSSLQLVRENGSWKVNGGYGNQ
ncbi:MAG: hypothetical protein ACR2LV_04715 [Solirubrobacteraceae bacterium]